MKYSQDPAPTAEHDVKITFFLQYSLIAGIYKQDKDARQTGAPGRHAAIGPISGFPWSCQRAGRIADGSGDEVRQATHKVDASRYGALPIVEESP